MPVRPTIKSMAKPKQKLTDVMVAMDVVDTLRHRSNIIKRELNTQEQDTKLIERLKSIYTSQGLEVSDDVLKDGVTALREDRFKYKEPKNSFSAKIAKAYVTRGTWGKYILYALIAFIALLLIYNIFIKQPTADEVQTIQNEQSYKLRIYSEHGERSGIWRIPDSNPNAKNYYIIVEPINALGKTQDIYVINEETNESEKTDKFAVRVSEELFNSIGADKKDDGIIQNNILGEKKSQEDIIYIDGTLGGIITKW